MALIGQAHINRVPTQVGHALLLSDLGAAIFVDEAFKARDQL